MTKIATSLNVPQPQSATLMPAPEQVHVPTDGNNPPIRLWRRIAEAVTASHRATVPF